MSDDQVREIKTKIEIEKIIGERIKLKKAGKNFKSTCPFHSEKTPSFVVSPDIGIYKCFGCGESGDVFTFLEKYEGMDFPESLEYLAKRAGVKLKPRKYVAKGIRERIYEVNKIAANFYSYCLTVHDSGKRAYKYLLEDRGMTKDTIFQFRVGYCPDVPFAMEKYALLKNKLKLDDLVSAGIVYKRGRGVVDRFRGRVIFPLYDHRGNICGFSGRILPWMNSKKLAKYINSPETPAYSKSNLLFGMHLTKGEIKKRNQAIVVEGELDLVSPWQRGIKNMVALKGSALTLNQVKLLSRYTRSIVFALDADSAGNDAAVRGIAIAQNENLEIRVASLGKYKDPDDMVRKDSKAFKKAIREAVDVWEFLINQVFEKYKGKGGVEKMKISKAVVPILGSINDEIVRAYYADIVARKLSVSVEAVHGQVSKSVNGKKANVLDIQSKESVGVTRADLLEERLMSLAFADNPKIILKRDVKALVVAPVNKKIIERLGKFMIRKKSYSPKVFMNYLPAELKLKFTEIILKNETDFVTESEREKELSIVVQEIMEIKIREKLRDVAEKIKNAEKSKKHRDKLNVLNQSFNKLAKDLRELEENQHKGIILKQSKN